MAKEKWDFLKAFMENNNGAKISKNIRKRIDVESILLEINKVEEAELWRKFSELTNNTLSIYCYDGASDVTNLSLDGVDFIMISKFMHTENILKILELIESNDEDFLSVSLSSKFNEIDSNDKESLRISFHKESSTGGKLLNYTDKVMRLIKTEMDKKAKELLTKGVVKNG